MRCFHRLVLLTDRPPLVRLCVSTKHSSLASQISTSCCNPTAASLKRCGRDGTVTSSDRVDSHVRACYDCEYCQVTDISMAWLPLLCIVHRQQVHTHLSHISLHHTRLVLETRVLTVLFLPLLQSVALQNPIPANSQSKQHLVLSLL